MLSDVFKLIAIQYAMFVEREREILQGFASRGQSLVPIMAILSNTLMYFVCMCMKGVPHPKK